MQFANIGKAMLVQMLGLQKNYKEEVVDTVQELDEELSGCYSCITYKYSKFSSGFCDHRCTECSNCKKKVYKEKKIYKRIYVNEFNRFGYKCRLKPFALKLMLLLHFFSPDEHGFCYDVDPYYCAKYLGCNQRTIKNNFSLLQCYGYLEYKRISAHNYVIFLKDYTSYYLSAAKGGRGYITIEQTLMDEIQTVKDINSLRIILRELLDFDSLLGKGEYISDCKTIQQLQRFLPSYCKSWLVINIINNLHTDIFQINKTSNGYKFTFNQNYSTKTSKSSKISMYDSEMWEFVQSVDQALDNQDLPQSYKIINQYFFDYSLNKYLAPISLKNAVQEEEIDSQVLGKLTIQYDLERVKNAIVKIYKDYIFNLIPIQNLGALVRSIIENTI